MCIRCDPQELIAYAGHDGTEQIDHRTRAFTVEEFVSFLYNRSYCAIPFVRKAEYMGGVINLKNDPPLHMQGILIYDNHAVAWDGDKIYDPNGKIYPLKKDYDMFWLIDLFECTLKSNT
jgi:hypothetical protein